MWGELLFAYHGPATFGMGHNDYAIIGQGFANKCIAHILEIPPETVKSHVKRIVSKLVVSKRTEAVSRVGSLGLL
jgi:ATP/maltotriose-dependent transcriptional regulator MalT